MRATGAYVSWHQDATYFALEPACHVTAWVALTDAPVEGGLHGGRAGLAQARPAAARRACRTPTTCCRAARPWRSTSTAAHRLHAGEGRPVLAAPHASGAQFAAQPLSTTAASGSASATSRPGALHRRHASPPCWCAARTGTAISTMSGGRPRGRAGGARVPRRGRGALPGDECRRIVREPDRRRETRRVIPSAARDLWPSRSLAALRTTAPKGSHSCSVCPTTTATPIRRSPSARTIPGRTASGSRSISASTSSISPSAPGDGHLLTVAGTPPDPRTFAWRDYGNRVGVWRCLDLFDELNLPAAHLINTTVFDYAPQIVDGAEGARRRVHRPWPHQRRAPRPDVGGRREALPRGGPRRDREGLGQAAARLDGAVDGLDATTRPIS